MNNANKQRGAVGKKEGGELAELEAQTEFAISELSAMDPDLLSSDQQQERQILIQEAISMGVILKVERINRAMASLHSKVEELKSRGTEEGTYQAEETIVTCKHCRRDYAESEMHNILVRGQGPNYWSVECCPKCKAFYQSQNKQRSREAQRQYKRNR